VATGAIVAAVCITVGVCALIVAVLCCIRRRKRRQEEEQLAAVRAAAQRYKAAQPKETVPPVRPNGNSFGPQQFNSFPSYQPYTPMQQGQQPINMQPPQQSGQPQPQPLQQFMSAPVGQSPTVILSPPMQVQLPAAGVMMSPSQPMPPPPPPHPQQLQQQQQGQGLQSPPLVMKSFQPPMAPPRPNVHFQQQQQQQQHVIVIEQPNAKPLEIVVPPRGHERTAGNEPRTQSPLPPFIKSNTTTNGVGNELLQPGMWNTLDVNDESPGRAPPQTNNTRASSPGGVVSVSAEPEGMLGIPPQSKQQMEGVYGERNPSPDSRQITYTYE
jgi:hypothetical protein